VAALALTFLPQMLVILGYSTALQYIAYGAAIIAGMLVSGDRVAALLGRVLRPAQAIPRTVQTGNKPS
jgi:ribose/xylose/arabinose/galactoside ABC-type transport system permease subunit